MFKKQIEVNVEFIDTKIGMIIMEMENYDNMDDKEVLYDELYKLTELRNRITDSKVKDSNSKLWISGAIQVVGILTVLHYEKADAVVSKAYSMATGMFKGSV